MINQQKLAKKIKAIREGLDLSQEIFASKIGLSRVAVSQLESGKRGLEALELAKIAEVLGVSMDYLLQEERGVKVKTKSQQEFKVDKNKLKNVILYILEKCGGKPNLGETVLYKLLYFVDFDNYELSGEPITKISYCKLQFGPVPSMKDYNSAIDEMLKENQLKIISQNYYGMLQKRYVALKNCDISIFKSNELKVIDSIINRLSDMNANQIENYVHGDAPWQIAGEKQIIDYDLVFERISPYARHDNEKVWQDVSAMDTLKALGPISDEEYNYYKNL